MAELEIHHNDPDRFWASRGPALTAELVTAVAEARAAMARVLDVVGELDRDDIHRLAGYGSLPKLLTALVRVHPREARRWVERAEQLGETITPTGHHRPAALPATRAAMRDAVVDGEHIDIIATTMGGLPAWVDESAREGFEAALAEQARTTNPAELRVSAQRMLAVLDQDGPEPSDDPPRARNFLAWRRHHDGTVHGRFELTPTDGATLETLITALSTPREHDQRDQAERHGDALAELCHLAQAAPDLPTEAGERPHLHLTATIETLRDGVGRATLDTGATLTAAELRVAACDSAVIPYVMGGATRPLDVGRMRYTIPTHLRRALILRDQGCAFPRCDRRPRSCHGHHVRMWAHGGPTALDNLVLLCGQHHRLIHNSDWAVKIVDGLPEFTPPAYLDPYRRPLPATPRHSAA
ncbi:DUF222 domain-containing protein [Actinokineospora sp.]|uniref:HNH endonuclease signature motif containing protein n=1 Tax=Actinokineospora sp. TaxID=1872133 RepID=UPI003D6AEAC0